MPELSGHQGGAALDPRTCASALGDARRGRGLRRLALDRSTGCAGSLPVLQGMSVGLSGQRGHGDLQGGVHSSPLCAAALGAAVVALVDGLAAAVVADGGSGASPGQQVCTVENREAAGRDRFGASCAGVRSADLLGLVRCQKQANDRGAAGQGGALAGHLHQSPVTRDRPSSRRGSRGGRLRSGTACQTGLLRSHLDLDRPARRRQESHRALSGRSRATPRGRYADRRARAELHSCAPAGRARPSGRRQASRGRRQLDVHAGGVLGEVRLGTTAGRGRGAGPDALPPTRSTGLRCRQDADGRGRDQRCHPRLGLLRPGRQLRVRT